MDHETFSRMMAVFPTGVTIVTARHADGTPRGTTVNAFSSVSASPPICMICLAKDSNTMPAVIASAGFVINFLDIGQQALSRHFASKRTDKFDGVAWTPTANGLPILEGVAATVECDLRRCLDVGDHWLLLGTVKRGQICDNAVPLAYYRRQYGTFTPVDQEAAVSLPRARIA